MRWNWLVKYELRVTRHDVVGKFADRLVAMADVELLGSMVEGRYEQEHVTAFAI